LGGGYRGGARGAPKLSRGGRGAPFRGSPHTGGEGGPQGPGGPPPRNGDKNKKNPGGSKLSGGPPFFGGRRVARSQKVKNVWSLGGTTPTHATNREARVGECWGSRVPGGGGGGRGEKNPWGRPPEPGRRVARGGIRAPEAGGGAGPQLMRGPRGSGGGAGGRMEIWTRGGHHGSFWGPRGHVHPLFRWDWVQGGSPPPRGPGRVGGAGTGGVTVRTGPGGRGWGRPYGRGRGRAGGARTGAKGERKNRPGGGRTERETFGRGAFFLWPCLGGPGWAVPAPTGNPGGVGARGENPAGRGGRGQKGAGRGTEKTGVGKGGFFHLGFLFFRPRGAGWRFSLWNGSEGEGGGGKSERGHVFV